MILQLPHCRRGNNSTADEGTTDDTAASALQKRKPQLTLTNGLLCLLHPRRTRLIADARLRPQK